MSWTLVLLAAHPHLYADVMDELTEKLRGDAVPTVEKLGELELLDRVIKESQRLLPASSILFFGAAQQPFTLDGHEFPAGSRLLTSPFLAHRDPAVFEEPRRFAPQRWERLEPTTYEYLPFGAGPRLCIGAQFAAVAIRTALAMLLTRFRFEIVPGTRIDRHMRGITLGAKQGIATRLGDPRGPFAAPGSLRGDIHDVVDGLPR